MSSLKAGDKVICINDKGWEHSDVKCGYEYVLVEEACEGEFGKLYIKYAEEEHEDFQLKEEYSAKHYDTFYHLTDKDIEQGKIKIDAYFVAKQWKVGSKDDSGALFHNLKTIARFGEKNSIEREIKALYNQTLALARIYNVELD